MLDASLSAFVRASLPAPPAQVLEVGAGRGELAERLTQAGYGVVAIDPASQVPHVQAVALDEFDAPDGSFDAAVAVVSLHHVEPLARSCERLARLLSVGAPLVIDEFDIGKLDAAAATWWLAQQPAHAEHAREPDAIVADMRNHLHPLSHIVAALEPWFEFGELGRHPYLYRWELGPSLRSREELAITRGEIPATGARVVARRRDYIAQP